LHKMGALDFSGGNVVHINAGVSGLVLSLFLDKRLGYGKESMILSSVTFTAFGTKLLWFGWFGFNAGNALAANGAAAAAFLRTNTAAATAGLAWVFIEGKISEKPTLLGIASGIIARLVGITPAARFVTLGKRFPPVFSPPVMFPKDLQNYFMETPASSGSSLYQLLLQSPSARLRL
jgi:ammonium transporter, Amt family